jgi:hypothetical protein
VIETSKTAGSVRTGYCSNDDALGSSIIIGSTRTQENNSFKCLLRTLVHQVPTPLGKLTLVYTQNMGLLLKLKPEKGFEHQKRQHNNMGTGRYLP